MARKNKEADSAYNKAYYERLKADPKRRAERTKKSVARKVQKNYEERVKRWEHVLLIIRGMQALGATDHEIAESYAKDYILKKTTKSKWIDFSPLPSKSLSSSLSSSSAARPARTQPAPGTQEGDAEQAHSPSFPKGNARAKCTKCGDVIESKSLHDYRHCECGAISVDGGDVCPRFGGNYEDFDQKFWEEQTIKEVDQ